MTSNSLIVYYSRTGKCEILAKALQEKLGCGADKIDYAERDEISFPAAVLETLGKKTAQIKGVVNDPSVYERIILITPIWGGVLATPIRSYLDLHKNAVKSYLLLAVCGGSGIEGAVKEAGSIIGKPPLLSRQFLSAQIDRGAFYIEDLS